MLGITFFLKFSCAHGGEQLEAAALHGMLRIAVALIFLCAQSYWGKQLQAAALRVKWRESRDFKRRRVKRK